MAGLSEFDRMVIKSEQKRLGRATYCKYCGLEILNFNAETYKWELAHKAHFTCAKKHADESQFAREYEKWLAENTPKPEKGQ